MSSTAITLNDRFLMLQKSSDKGNGTAAGRGRSRSRSRGRQQVARNGNGRLQGSRISRVLLDRLENQHKARISLKNAKSTLRPGRIQGRAQIIRNRARRAATIKKAINPRALRRNNSLTTFVPLKDEPSRAPFRGRSRSRSRSRNRSQQRQQQPQQRGSVLDRLGFQNRQGRGRMRMRRGPPAQQQQQQQQLQRSRSRSRVKLNRNNFRNQNQNNQLKRSNSKVNLAPQQAQKRRANSRARRPGVVGGANQIRRQPRRNNNNQFNRPVGGRIVKRTTIANAKRAGQVMKLKQRRGSIKNVNRWTLTR
jgi:hypothetical protein